MEDVMLQEHTLQVLVCKAQGGDRAAFDTLVDQYRNRLIALIQARLGAHLQGFVESDDIVQDTLMRAFKAVERFRWQGEDSFVRWLGGIAEHVILKAAQRHPRHERLRLETEHPANGASPSTVARRHERFDRLEEALQGLSDDHRKVILLARIEGLPIKEIARRMNRSESAVKNLLLRALTNLRSGFGDTESLHLPDRRLTMGGQSDDR